MRVPLILCATACRLGTSRLISSNTSFTVSGVGTPYGEVRSHFARDFVHESETVTFRVFPLQIALKHNT
jgi:hypothetical protein